MLLLWTQGASALDLTLEALHEAEYSTNVGRSSGSPGAGALDDEEDEGWIQQPGGRIGLSHETAALDLAGDYEARRRIYQNDGYDDETVVTGTARLEWRALPDRLLFDVSNARTETTIDSREAFAPDNRQVTSTTSAGTTLQIDSVGAQFMTLGYRYEWEAADETVSDSETQTGEFAYVIPVSTTRRVQLNGSVADEDFENDLAPDTTTYSGDLQFVTTGATLETDVAIGYTLVERELDRDDVDGITGRGRLVWSISPDRSLTLAYAHEITTDTPEALSGTPDFGEEFDDNSRLNEVYTSDDASVTYGTQIGRNLVTLGATYRTLDYEDVPNDEDTVSGSLVVERRIRPTVTGSLFSTVSKTEFDIDGRQDDQWDSGLRISWGGFRRLTLAVSASYYQQESDDETKDYDEWRGVLSIGYLLVGRR